MAYAALLSLTHTIEQALHRDHHFLIPDEKQKVRSLLENVSSLLDFLDNSPQIIIEKEEGLERKVIDLAYKAEDIIESRVILSEQESQRYESFTTLSQNIEKFMEEIVAMTNQVMNLKIAENGGVREQQQSRTCVPVQLSRGAPSDSSTMVGADAGFRKIKHLLTGGTSDLQIVSIYGMAGIGKTTMAQKVYNDASVKLHFDYCAWVTISQDFTMEKILLGLLGDTQARNLTEKQTDRLKESMYKNLKNRRYLAVMDDVWDNKAWDHVKRLLPNDSNGSRIILTTRRKDVASYPEPSPHLHPIDLLDPESSWKLFCEAFGKDSCPLDLAEIGRNIVKHCGGLPLAIVVIGGLLAKIPTTQHEWSNIEEDLSSILISNDERYSKIWSLSYYNLPHHLKGCFLYMGVFPEDFDIRISILTKLWVAEGLIRPQRSKNIEEVATEYLGDLTERCLISVCEFSFSGEGKICKVHDLLRDICISEAKRVMFFHVTNSYPKGIPDGTCVRRLSIHQVTESLRNSKPPSTEFLRSVSDFEWSTYPYHASYSDFLRILHVYSPLSALAKNLGNLRCIIATGNKPGSLQQIYTHQNLQSVMLYDSSSTKSLPLYELILEPEFWKMIQLIHFQSEAAVNLPPYPSHPTVVLENLQTLSNVKNFRCTKEVIERIPSLQKLGIFYEDADPFEGYDLNNLQHLHKLEALKCSFNEPSRSFLKNLTFPESLKNLTLVGGELCWKDMEIAGLLCNLRVLKLKDNAFTGRKWKLKEGKFAKLEFLLLDDVYLVHWIADDTHFENLQRLVIKNCRYLRKLPSVIGESLNLQLIELHNCGGSLIRSAKKLEKELRENCGNEIIKFVIYKEQCLSMYCLSQSSFLVNQPFPTSLEKITLRKCGLPWKNMTVLGILPKLEVLELRKNAFSGPKWAPREGEFLKLSFLLLLEINLQCWIANENNFPSLEILVIKKCKYLRRIPYWMGDISTLEAIRVHDCTDSLVESAKEIQQDQIELGNEGLDVVIT